MKKISLALLLMGFLCTTFIQAQTKTINSFYKKHKKTDGAHSMSLPGFAIDIAASIVKFSAESEEEKQAIKLLKKVNKVKFLHIENENTNLIQDVKLFKANLKKDSFDEMLSMRSGNTRFEFMIKPKKEKLKNILLYIKDGEETIMISLKTKIKLKDIQKLLNGIQSEYDLELDIPKEIRETKDEDELLRA